MKLENVGKWWKVSADKEKGVIREVKKLLFPKVDEKDWHILEKWFEFSQKNQNRIPLSLAVHLTGDINFDITNYCEKFKNNFVRLDATNSDNKTIQIDNHCKVLIYENLESVRKSLEWYPQIKRAVMLGGKSKFVFTPQELNEILFSFNFAFGLTFSSFVLPYLVDTGLAFTYVDNNQEFIRIFNQIDVVGPDKWAEEYYFNYFPRLEYLIEQNGQKVLEILSKEPMEKYMGGKTLEVKSQLSIGEINLAIDHLEKNGLIERLNGEGTEPYNFASISLNSKGRFYISEQAQTVNRSLLDMMNDSPSVGNQSHELNPFFQLVMPAGSPFGFTDQDWEYVSKKKRQHNVLYVVLGLQYDSAHYNMENVKNNIRSEFERAIDRYNEKLDKSKVELEFSVLKGGYGEHLFNHIAREIISADIAVFETSDINPNVMIELGVALTWGTRVLPIKKVGVKTPPSDISGQTWAEYNADGADFTNKEHYEDMLYMIDRAIQKKIRIS